jgi:hypothetical protein
MRQRYLLVLVGVVAVALAVGALPSLLQSGDPYRVEATDVGNASTFDGTAYDVTNVSDRRYPYLVRAVETGVSDRYYEGPFGVKESLSHSPFDEFGAIETRVPNAVDDRVAYVTYDGTVYRLEIVRGER